jgi:hypothetical protein
VQLNHTMPPSLQSPTQLKSQPPWNPSKTREVPISNPRERKELLTPIQEEPPSYTEASGSRSGFETPYIPPSLYSRKVRAPAPNVRKFRTPPVKVTRDNPPASELPPYYDVDPVIAASRALQSAIAGCKPVIAKPTFSWKGRPHKLRSTLRI